MLRPVGLDRRPEIAAAALAVALAVLVGGSLTLDWVTPRVVQLAIGAGLVAVFVRLDNDAPMIPRVLRPATAVFASSLLASSSTFYLVGDEFETAYLPLWLVQTLGFLAGHLAFPRMSRRLRGAQLRVNLRKLDRYAWWMFWVCLAAAVMYLRTVGIGALGGDLEQSRIDAAQGTTGYLRLIAFLTPAAAALLFATRGRRAWFPVAAAALFILSVGSRIPLLYFAFPLVVVVALVGQKIKSRHIVVVAILALVFLGWYGAFRIEGQEGLNNHPMYKAAVAQGDTTQVAMTAVEHYAGVIPANAVLVKRLVDQERIPLQYGQTYTTLFISVLPGRQVSPDMMVREASNKEFIGGGIPPTLMGEGYMNWGWPGVFLNAMALMLLARYWGSVVVSVYRSGDRYQLRVVALIYGYVIAWAVFAQTSGFAGSATITLATFLVFVAMRRLARA